MYSHHDFVVGWRPIFEEVGRRLIGALGGLLRLLFGPVGATRVFGSIAEPRSPE
jgi:hypothetical protein